TGGDLGLTPRGSFDDAFETALYSLPEGGVSAPVETEFGIHLIRADKIIKQDVKSLAEMKAELTADVRRSKARDLYNNKLKDLSDLAFSAQSLDDLAQDLKLPVQESQLFSADRGEGIAQFPEVREAAFSSTVLDSNEISPVIELEDSALVMVIKEHKAETVKALAEVKEQITAKVKLTKAIEKAKEQAKAIVAGAEAKGWKTVTTAYSASSEAPATAQQKAFAMKTGEKAYVQSQGSVVVVALDKIDKKNWQDIQVANEQVEMGRLMNSRSDLVSYQNWARSASKIKQ
ncbi:MAG: peptidyl-prolyl cis-trans isomerase, partial [Venatoribacter sp.]